MKPFSKLRHLETYFSKSMTDERLSNLVLLNIYNDMGIFNKLTATILHS